MGFVVLVLSIILGYYGYSFASVVGLYFLFILLYFLLFPSSLFFLFPVSALIPPSWVLLVLMVFVHILVLWLFWEIGRVIGEVRVR